MMNIFRLAAVAAAFLLLPNMSFASFTYQDKPISPTCIATLVDIFGEAKEFISLDACQTSADLSGLSVKNGLVSTKNNNSEVMEPYSSYQIIGENGSNYLLEFTEWGGGSGFFSSIVWLSKEEGKLKFISLPAMGDRCNSGVAKVGDWQYSVNLTPADFMTFANKPKVEVKAYDELDASAASCVAKAIYSFDPDAGKAILERVVLGNRALPMDVQPTIKYQKCFNRIYNEYVVSDNRELDQNGINYFASEFSHKCMQLGRVASRGDG